MRNCDEQKRYRAETSTSSYMACAEGYMKNMHGMLSAADNGYSETAVGGRKLRHAGSVQRQGTSLQ